jgi:hypothetical protein
MTQYVKRPRNSADHASAATYRFGEPLHEVTKVARFADPDADVVEIPEWRLLLVRHTKIPDNAPSYTDYDVVEDGQILVFSHQYDLLYAEDAASFHRQWAPPNG